MLIDTPQNIEWTYLPTDEQWQDTDNGSGQTLAGFRTKALGWLNRGDLNAVQATEMINDAIRRINRELRVPEMEQVGSYEVPEGGTAVRICNMPSGVAAFKDVLIDGRRAYPQPYRMLRHPSPSMRHSFARQGNLLYLFPAARAGIEVTYYQNFAPLVNDTDTTTLFEFGQDLLLWAFLSYAGDYFRMASQPQWEANYNTALTALNEKAIDTESLGGPLSVGAVGAVDERNDNWISIPGYVLDGISGGGGNM